MPGGAVGSRALIDAHPVTFPSAGRCSGECTATGDEPLSGVANNLYQDFPDTL